MFLAPRIEINNFLGSMIGEKENVWIKKISMPRNWGN